MNGKAGLSKQIKPEMFAGRQRSPGHGDYIWEGSFGDPPATDMETWFVRGGSAVAAYHTFRQPGLYVYLNHNLIEGVMLGAAAHFQVDGDWNNALMEQVSPPAPIEA